MIAIIGVPILTASFALSIAWYAQSSMSRDPKVRCQAWLVEVLMLLGVLVLSAATTPSLNEWKCILITVGAVSAVWLFRGMRILLRKKGEQITQLQAQA